MVKTLTKKLIQVLRFLSDLIYSSQTMKVILSLIVIAFATKVNSQPPQLPVIQFDINDFMAHQQQHMHHLHPQGRDHQHMHEQGRQMEATEPLVGSPLMGLKMGMPFGLHHALGGLGIPGMKFSNFQAGNIGGLKFHNSLLGAENPMAEEDNDQLQGKKWKWYKHAEPLTGSEQHYQAEPQLAAPPQQQQQGFFPFHLLNGEANQGAEPQVATAPHQPQEFFPFHHWLNDDSSLGAAQQQNFDSHQAQQYQLAAQQMQQFDPQHYQVAAPQMHQFDHQHHQVAVPQFDMQPVGPPMSQQMLPVGPPMSQQMQHLPVQLFPDNPEIPDNTKFVQMEAEDGSRSWGKWGKKGGDSYNSGGYG